MLEPRGEFISPSGASQLALADTRGSCHGSVACNIVLYSMGDQTVTKRKSQRVCQRVHEAIEYICEEFPS